MLDSRRAAYDWVLHYLLKPNLGHNLFVHTSHHFLFPKLRACLSGAGGPQVGDVTFGGSPHLSCKRDQINMRDYMARGLPHLSGLPHLPGVPNLHVNRP